MNQMTRTASPTPQAAISKPTVAPPAAAIAAPLVAARQTTAPIIPRPVMGSPIRQPPSSATGSPVARAAEVLSLSDIFVPIESVQPGEHLLFLDDYICIILRNLIRITLSSYMIYVSLASMTVKFYGSF